MYLAAGITPASGMFRIDNPDMPAGFPADSMRVKHILLKHAGGINIEMRRNGEDLNRGK